VRSERAEVRIEKLEKENAELKARLTALEQLIKNLDPNGN
jgi:cell division protein FtsB